MTAKLVFVLIFLVFVATFLISPRTMREVLTGFVRFGEIPLRADTIIDGRHFTVHEQDGGNSYRVQGTVEKNDTVITSFQAGDKVYKIDDDLPPEYLQRQDEMVARAKQRVHPDRFFFEQTDGDVTLSCEGEIDQGQGGWRLQRVTVDDAGTRKTYDRLDEIPDKSLQKEVRELTENQGLRRVQLLGFIRAHGRLPDLDWTMIATFASIAGAGGLTNVLLSNYARDKGWGMGARVGAIPSAIGGATVTLSHVGQTFRPTAENMTRWRGWMRHIIRDQAVIWMLACFIGMALPCMISVEFIRNAPIAGQRVPALTAEGIDHQYPGYGLWLMTLVTGFLILYPGQIMSGDTVPRRWCDIIWTTSARARRLGEEKVKYIYYAIMLLIAIWGLLALILLDPLLILKIGGVLMNVGLGASALHALYLNCTILPPEVRPNWFMRIGVLFCGLFFFGISAIVFVTTLL